MIDLVYIVGDGSKCDDLELRYSVRSMVKHLKGFRAVYIVGHLPCFLKGVIHVPCPDHFGFNKARNIYEKILAACRREDLSEKFICASDDHFLLKDFDAGTFPYFYHGTLWDTISKLSTASSYKVYVENTYKALAGANLPTVNYNLHCPIIYDKGLFSYCMARYDWTGKKGFLSKSLYANTMKMAGQLLRDLKIHTPKTKTAIYRKLKDATIFSTDEFSINADMKEVLQELYPNPSPWEK